MDNHGKLLLFSWFITSPQAPDTEIQRLCSYCFCIKIGYNFSLGNSLTVNMMIMVLTVVENPEIDTKTLVFSIKWQPKNVLDGKSSTKLRK